MNVGSQHGYKITTIDAFRFWSSDHKCNRVKAIIAFSKDLEDANNNLKRAGYKNLIRKRILLALGGLVNNPSMKNIPFSTCADKWWDCFFKALGVGIYVKWKLTKNIDGHWGRAYFLNGDYILVGSGAKVDGKVALTPGHIYQYQGVGLSGIPLVSAIPDMVDKGVYDPTSDKYNIGYSTELETFYKWFDKDKWPDIIRWEES